MPCSYCNTKAIGYERVYGTPDNINVCTECAHVGATVHLFDGGTSRKTYPRCAECHELAADLTNGRCVGCGDTWIDPQPDPVNYDEIH